MEPYIWLILLVILIITELLTAALTTVWFAGGALAAYVSALIGAGTAVQVMVFVAVSLLLLIFTRPLVVKYINSKAEKTNKPESIIGRTAVVTEEINNLSASGKILIDSMPWTARTAADGEVIPEGCEVEIVSISGVKCIVSLRNTESGN